MNDVDQLEADFIAKGGGEFEDHAALPPGFAERLPDLRGDPNQAFNEREMHLSFARRLLNQLGDANNRVVQMQKFRSLRAELNALRLLDSMVR